jgi:hypothetical protein
MDGFSFIRAALALAADADISLNSAKKALREGPDKLRGRTGEKATASMKRLRLRPLVAVASDQPPPSKVA